MFGDETYKRIPDAIGRREVGMLFASCLFDLDRQAFIKHYDNFTSIFFQSMVARRITQQHTFTNQLLNEMGQEDALFQNVAAGKMITSDVYAFTSESFLRDRARFIDGQFCF